MMKIGYFIASILVLADGRLVKRQIDDALQPQLLCCRCVDASVGCADLSDPKGLPVGLTCITQAECFQLLGGNDPFATCENECKEGVSPALASIFEQRIGETSDCPSGQVSCCSHVETGLVTSVRIGLVEPDDPLGEGEGKTKPTSRQVVCKNDKISAIANLQNSNVCGKRDERVYKHVDLPESFTNPGEWPWVAMLFTDNGNYIGAGAYIQKDTVITVAHKVINYVKSPGKLVVRLGDWNPNGKTDKELFDYLEFAVDCVKLHPQHDHSKTLANNVAVLKLGKEVSKGPSVADVIVLKSSERDAPSYHHICLPSPNQFSAGATCWVAAWGNKLERQREVDLPIFSREQCINKLRPIFDQKGVKNWAPHSSEFCAGGEVGKDTCLGEGGAPLVCLDRAKDQYFAVGLVAYGFGCETSNPGVYTNLMDIGVNQFIQSALDDDTCISDFK